MLTLQFVPYADIEQLDSDKRVRKLLTIVKANKIVLMQGRLHPEEETLLIQRTMEEIQDGFKGIETCTIYPEEKNLQFFNKVKKEMVKALIGQREGITIIGPSTVVKEIRRDPNKIHLLTVGNVRAPKVKPRKTKQASRARTTRKTTKTTRRRKR